MAQFIITRKHSYGSIALRTFLWLLIGSIVFYVVLTNSAVGAQVREWLHKTWDSHRNPFDSSNQVPVHANLTLSSEQMKPIFVRDLIMRTNSGQLKGFVQNVSGVQIGTFMSIPYGQPPVAQLRFRPTEPVHPWSDIRDATAVPPPCIQSEYTQRLFPVHILNENITENCLFLNIWTPVVRFNSTEKKKSVMVLIHGGLFTIGSIGIDEYDGRMLAAKGDVVVVTIQYRLGIFGFLDMDNEAIPGNMGLFDQFTAFQWIHDNVGHFGGDKDSVTLFGTSAGSISIGFHMFSARASGLFRRAILQSGSPMLLKQVYSRGEKLAEKFATMVGCFDKGNGTSIYEDPDTVVQCLDQVPFETIYRVQGELVDNNPVPFMPTIPSEYIDNFINDFNESTVLQQKEVMMGFNTNEGALMLHAAYPKVYTRHQVPQYRTLKQVQQRVVEMGVDSGLNENQATSIATLLIRGKDQDTPTKWAQVVADLFSDIMFVCPTYEFANKLQSLNLTTYLYLFAQRAKNAEWGDWMEVTHHDEVSFIMGYPLRYPHLFSDEDIYISAQMIKTWTHFAKSGEIAQEEFPEQWLPYSALHKYYMQIKAGQTRLGDNFHNESCDLYNLLSEYMN